MDYKKMGELIRQLRVQNQLTQKQLAEELYISDKTVSKWERGLGCPDIALLRELAQLFNINMEKLLLGELKMNEVLGGNFRMIKFYRCPKCGNIMNSIGPAEIACCGKKLEALEPHQAEGEHQLKIETVEDEWYVTTAHEMTKTHFISFVAFVTGDKVYLIKQYPEWCMQLRLPKIGRGKLYSYCTQHGLSYQII